MGKLTTLILLWIGSYSLQAQTALQGITVLGTDTIICPETILKGDTVRAVFYVANNGTSPFRILQVYASCQCTAPQYAQDTFQPGRQDSVIMYFHSKKTEEEAFEKYVLVLTPLGEKAFYLKGIMHTPKENERVRQPKMIYLNNKLTP